MADSYEHDPTKDEAGDAESLRDLTGDASPVEEEPMEVEMPRRAASAQFVVDGAVGSEAAVREAMDPANQSLADALRLSFRVLQVVIIALIGLFAVSGFQTVSEGQSGVKLLFQKIVASGADGQEALEPGLRWSVLPYPAGEFVLINVQNRQVDIGEAFFPALPPGRTLEQATQEAQVTTPLMPGRDGMLLTRDGDVAHLRVTGRYDILFPATFLRRLDEPTADRLVRMALRRATIRVVSTLSLQEVTDASEDMRQRIRQTAQDSLAAMESGIQLTDVTITQSTPALAIKAVQGDLLNAQFDAGSVVQSAREKATDTLVKAAGEQWSGLIRLIESYEERLDVDAEAAEGILDEIHTLLETRAGGEVANIIRRAQSFETEIQNTLGNKAQRFASILSSYEQNPQLVVTQLWLEAYGKVMSRRDTEIWYMPTNSTPLTINMEAFDFFAETRRDSRIERRRMEQQMQDLGGPFIVGAEDINLSGPGRQLDRELRPTGR